MPLKIILLLLTEMVSLKADLGTDFVAYDKLTEGLT